jgi:chain length determinant protein EpsF
MTISQLIAILRARRLLALSIFVGTIALGLLVSFVLPARYTAEATVVVDVKPDPIEGAMSLAMSTTPSIMATQVDIIVSDRVTRRVIHDLKLDQNPVVQQQWKSDGPGSGTVEDWLVDTLQRKLDVKPSKEGNVIAITYKAPDPKFAATLANAFANAYLETVLELRVDPAKQYNDFFESKTKEARRAVETAQEKLSAYQRDNGIVGDDEHYDVETSRLNQLTEQLVLQQAIAAESTSRQRQASQGKGDQMTESLGNMVVGGLKVDLARAEANLKELNSRLGVNNPQVQAAQANVNELRSRLDAETSRATSGVGVTAQINNARLADVRAQIEAQRTKVLKLKSTRDQLSVLQRDLQNAQRDYESIAMRFSQSKLASQTQQSNVYLLSSASPPLEPSFPRLPLNILISVFLGILFAIAAALLREASDRRVRGSVDIIDSLGLPMIGVMPRPTTKRGATLMAQRVISGRLAAPAKR